jgi:4-amino-4-deoxy-L-arabinose transferase-like glycosyltransferase
MEPITHPRDGRADRMVRWAPPLIVLAFYSVTAAGYGVFRDELYYFACARHLDWGYVDHPPMIAVLAAFVRVVFGESYLAARLLSALAAAGTVLLVGDTTRELGGGRWARLLAQLLCATAPVYLALFSIFSMNAFDVLVWAALIRIAARILTGGSPRLWLVFGVIAGLGLLNKLAVGLLGA